MPRTVDIAQRIRDLIGDKELDLTTATVSYTLVHGYERLHIRDGDYEYKHAEVFHPTGKCEGQFICHYCGKEVTGSNG